LRKGVEGDAAGKVERNGGWLASKDHVMKCMTAVEIAAQKEILLKGNTDTLALASQRRLSMALKHPHLADATIKEKSWRDTTSCLLTKKKKNFLLTLKM
jgi:hypothetical protein